MRGGKWGLGFTLLSVAGDVRIPSASGWQFVTAGRMCYGSECKRLALRTLAKPAAPKRTTQRVAVLRRAWERVGHVVA